LVLDGHHRSLSSNALSSSWPEKESFLIAFRENFLVQLQFANEPDVPYHDSTLSKGGCYTDVANPTGDMMAALNSIAGGGSDSCGAPVVGSARIDFDSTWMK
jgi:hypothetical protein